MPLSRGMRPNRGAAATPSRAPRFDLRLPVRYRGVTSCRWHYGTTRSVSASGALIRADAPVALSRWIVVEIALRGASGCLFGRGRVIRALAPAASRSRPMFAVAIGRYRIRRRSVERKAAAR